LIHITDDDLEGLIFLDQLSARKGVTQTPGAIFLAFEKMAKQSAAWQSPVPVRCAECCQSLESIESGLD
jgi:hypothetical protein